jgi:hypothetical protein
MRVLLLLYLSLFVYIYCNQTEERLQQDYNPPASGDNPSIFFKNIIYTSYIRALPKFGQVSRLPWSGDYLAYRYGGPSARYGDMDTRYKPYPISINMYHQPGDYLANKDRPDFSDYVNKYYSPAEKYDLYVGDYQFTLTRTAKNYGIRFNGGGDFASWMGLCHGLAPASYMTSTPNRAVTVYGADGKTKIQFLPDDIKAIATTWWGNVKFNNRLTGRRYSAVNAASFFIILGNQVGRFRKNISVEPFADAQIWNFGFMSYKTTYYNLKTGKEGLYLDCRLPRTEAPQMYALAGPAESAYVIGVKYTITYASNINAKHITTGQNREEKTSDYTMAIYMDAKDKIVGGVWSSRAKPSYLWGPDKIPEGPFDKYLPTFFGSSATLRSITEYAVQSSAQYLPLRSIVYYLTNISN